MNIEHWSRQNRPLQRLLQQQQQWQRLQAFLNQKLPPFWIENRVDHQLLLSTRHLNNDNAPLFADALRRYQPF